MTVSTSERVVSVLTLNLWNRADPWEQRLAVIRAGIAGLGPDLVALQEVVKMEEFSFDQAAEVAAGAGYYVAHGEAPGGPYPFGNALLSRYPLEGVEVLPLPREGTDENRCLVFARAMTPWGALPFATTHLNWRLDQGHVRVAQARFVAASLAALAEGAELPAILAGDFNAEPESDEIRYLRGYTGLGGPCVFFNDCFAAVGDGSRGATFARRNPNAAASREPDRRLDYVFVRGPDDRLRGVPLECRVCLDQPLGGVWASDHFGVFARIEV